MAVQPFPPRAGFVKRAEDGSFILTEDAYRFLRDLLYKTRISKTSTSLSDFDVLSQFADTQSPDSSVSRDETLQRIMMGGNYEVSAEFSKRLDFIETVLSQQNNPRGDLSKRIDEIETILAYDANPTALLSETVKWGTYTPTLTNVTGITASTAYVCQYVRLGRMAVVSGQVDIGASASGANMRLGFSLPIASDFSAEEQCGGVASASAIDLGVCSIIADASNNRAEFKGTPPSAANEAYSFIFMYRIL